MAADKTRPDIPVPPPVRSEAVPEVGVAMIRAERLRQVAVKGYDEEHDARHAHGELTALAVHWIRAAGWPSPGIDAAPRAALDGLVKAGALIAAEIDRIVAEEARRGC